MESSIILASVNVDGLDISAMRIRMNVRKCRVRMEEHVSRLRNLEITLASARISTREKTARSSRSRHAARIL